MCLELGLEVMTFEGFGGGDVFVVVYELRNLAKASFVYFVSCG
jgi:hypothetical protein